MSIPHRIARMNELLRKEIGTLVHDEIKDPRVGFSTVTAVEATPDLKYATVFVSVMGNEKDKESAITALQNARGYLQAKLGDILDLKYVPFLKFEIDDTADKSFKIEKIISKIHKNMDKGES